MSFAIMHVGWQKNKIKNKQNKTPLIIYLLFKKQKQKTKKLSLALEMPGRVLRTQQSIASLWFQGQEGCVVLLDAQKTPVCF